MRILFTTTGSAGHLGPLLPFADALRDAGEDVLIATRGSSGERARATGHAVHTFADAPAEQRAALMAGARQLPTDAANRYMAAEVFGGIDARAALPGVLETGAAWKPDVIVSEPSEMAGRVAAAKLGVPTALVAITQYAIEARMAPVTEDAMLRLAHAHGLPAPGAPARLTLLPRTLEDPREPGPPEVRRFREREGAPPAGAREDAPLVYVTFGSVAPQQAYFPDLYRAAIDALAPLPVRLLVTIGRDRDPADLGPVPDHVGVERWIPQAEVVARAAVVVCHGGSGTVRGALAAGVPLAILPLFADQHDNAARIAELGAGVALESAEDMGRAVKTLIVDPSYGERAAAVAREIRRLPSVDASVGELRALAA